MTTTRVKTAQIAHFKALDDSGTFEAIVSVFGNVDLVGDRVVKGAFADSLAEWAASGDPIPVIWSHQWADPDMHIGAVTEAEERDEGLYVKGTLDLDAPVAAQVHRLLKSRRVREFSFAYDVLDEKKSRDGANELLKLGIIEVGPTLKGANPDTVLIDAKAAPARKADRLAEQVERRADAKAWVRLAGSLEEQQEQVLAAVQAWASEQLGDDYYHAALEATYPDRVVFYAERWSDPWGEGEYYEAGVERAEDGVVTLVDPHMVTLTATVAPKSMQAVRWAKAAKAGARNNAGDQQRIQSAHDLMSELGAICPTATAVAADGAPVDAEGDVAFLEAMIPHHEAAIQMATDAQPDLADQRVKDLATAIITAQTAEIAQMRDWLGEDAPAAGAPARMPGMSAADYRLRLDLELAQIDVPSP